MKDSFTKTNSFSCPIYKIRIDPNSYDKEKILNDIKHNKSLKNTRNEAYQIIGSSATNIHHSYMDFDNEDFRIINYEKLVAAYLKIFDEFFDKIIVAKKEFKYEFAVVNYLAATEGQNLTSHNHVPTDDFATVHYLNFKDDHTPTLFHNPATFAPFLRYMRPELFNILENTSLDNQYIQEHFAWKVKEDDMLIFPSALNHEIKAQGPTKEPRITIATNIKILSQEEK